MKIKIFLSVIVLFLACISFTYAQVSGEEIIKQINNGENISYKNIEIKGDLDFTTIEDKVLEKGDYKNSTDRYLCNINSRIEFENCTFKGKVIAYVPDDDWDRKNIIYVANFLGGTIFKGCVFEEVANFKYTEFIKTANFEGAEFKELAFFKYSEFPEEPNFRNVTFHDEAFFKYTEFPHGVDFSNAKFMREANFKYTEFPKGVNFKDAVFSRLANFKYADFSEPFNLEEAELNGEVDLKYTKIDGKGITLYLLKNRK